VNYSMNQQVSGYLQHFEAVQGGRWQLPPDRAGLCHHGGDVSVAEDERRPPPLAVADQPGGRYLGARVDAGHVEGEAPDDGQPGGPHRAARIGLRVLRPGQAASMVTVCALAWSR
jgi:hypothetical protein